MADRRDCPLCGDAMELKQRDVNDRIPGQSQIVRRVVREWVCSGCDYYEEDEDQQQTTGR